LFFANNCSELLIDALPLNNGAQEIMISAVS